MFLISPYEGDQLDLDLSPGDTITTRSGSATVTHTEQAGLSTIIFADYGSGYAQPHIEESLLFPPEQVAQSPPDRPRRHSPKGKASGWIEQRIGNRKRKTPNTSYYYCWQIGEQREKLYIPARKVWRVQQMVEVEGRAIADVLGFLNREPVLQDNCLLSHETQGNP
jgi:hypothetical protein